VVCIIRQKWRYKQEKTVSVVDCKCFQLESIGALLLLQRSPPGPDQTRLQWEPCGIKERKIHISYHSLSLSSSLSLSPCQNLLHVARVKDEGMPESMECYTAVSTPLVLLHVAPGLYTVVFDLY
jgi:hypothetical protein